jgi:hypothetical protein
MCDEQLRPDEELTRMIAEKLLEEGLIPDRRLDAIRGKILGGTASEGDWRGWVFTAGAEDANGEVSTDA